MKNSMSCLMAAAVSAWMACSFAFARAPASTDGSADESPTAAPDHPVERDIQSVDANRQQVFSDRAAKKMYAGGRDEQELRPQASLPAPTRTIEGGAAPSVQVAPEPPAD